VLFDVLQRFINTMTIEEAERIISDLTLLRSSGSSVFGGDAHKFRLKPAMDERSLSQFEASHGVSLPSDYRTFLTYIGSGGAGPYYGLFDFGWMDHNHTVKRWHEGDGFVGVLRQPFSYSEHWNDLAGRPDSEMADSDEDEYWRLMEAFEERYYSAVDGAIPICHLGCALRHWLVVSGSEAGHVWDDSRADDEGFSPLSQPGHDRVTFYLWYRTWLDEALQQKANKP
jgi:hypothetical protein